MVSAMKDLKQREIFSMNLHYYLDFTGKTVDGLSSYLNVSLEEIQEWLDRMDMPNKRKLKKIADFLGVNVARLLEDKNRQNRAILERAYKKAPNFFMMLDQASPETASEIENVFQEEWDKIKNQDIKDYYV